MFSFIKSLFAPKVILVGKSELSNPTQCERPKRKLLFDKKLQLVLRTFVLAQSKFGPMTTHKFAMESPELCSVGQRLSELRKLEYLSAEKHDTPYGKRFVWSYTEKGYDAIYKN